MFSAVSDSISLLVLLVSIFTSLDSFVIAASHQDPGKHGTATFAILHYCSVQIERALITQSLNNAIMFYCDKSRNKLACNVQ